MARIISVVNQKGGVGKTTTAVNLSAAFGLRGLKTLLIDIDPQGNTTSGLGIDKKNLEKSSYDVLVNGAKIEEATIKTPYDNLYVVPSSINLVGAEIEMIDLQNRHEVLKKAVSLVAQQYDYIIFDCPPALGLITLNSLNASDRVLVPIQCEYFALEGLSQLMSTVRLVKTRYNPSLDLEGILFTMYDGRLNLTQQVVNEVKNFFPRKVFATFIPRSVRLSEAPSYGKPIQYYDAKNKGALAYNALCDEILKRR